MYVKHVTNGIPAAMVLFHTCFVFSKLPYPYLYSFEKHNKNIIRIILQHYILQQIMFLPA